MLGAFTKKEYEVMLSFYRINEPMTRKEFLERVPAINQATLDTVMVKLLKKRYMKVIAVKYSGSVLTRVFSPTLSLAEFYTKVHGKRIVLEMVKRGIQQMEDSEQLSQLLKEVEQAKSVLNLFTKKDVS